MVVAAANVAFAAAPNGAACHMDGDYDDDDLQRGSGYRGSGAGGQSGSATLHGGSPEDGTATASILGKAIGHHWDGAKPRRFDAGLANSQKSLTMLFGRRLGVFEMRCWRSGHEAAIEGAFVTLAQLQDAAWNAAEQDDLTELEGIDPFLEFLQFSIGCIDIPMM